MWGKDWTAIIIRKWKFKLSVCMLKVNSVYQSSTCREETQKALALGNPASGIPKKKKEDTASSSLERRD